MVKRYFLLYQYSTSHEATPEIAANEISAVLQSLIKGLGAPGYPKEVSVDITKEGLIQQFNSRDPNRGLSYMWDLSELGTEEINAHAQYLGEDENHKYLNSSFRYVLGVDCSYDKDSQIVMITIYYGIKPVHDYFD